MARGQFRVGPLLLVAIVFLLMAIIAAIFGFGNVAGLASPASQFVFIILAILFIVVLIADLDERRVNSDYP